MPGISAVGLSSMPLLKGYGWQNAIVGEKSSGAKNGNTKANTLVQIFFLPRKLLVLLVRET
jgi:hypothetical protein